MKKILLSLFILTVSLSAFSQQTILGTKSGITSQALGTTQFPNIATVWNDSTNWKLALINVTTKEIRQGSYFGIGGTQTIANTSDATSHTQTLSNSGGSTQFVEGSGITMATTGTGLNGIVTITATDASATNELQTLASTSDATSHTVTLSNSGGSLQLVEGSGITITTSGTGLNGIATIAASGGSGVTTMAAIGASPNANGATISGSTLTLQPASESFGGVLTTGTQMISGAKEFLSALTSSVSVTTPVLIGGTSTGATLQIRPTSGAGAAGADVIFQVGSNGGTEIMRMLSTTGYLGIGTAVPLMKVDITTGTQTTGNNSNNPTTLNMTAPNQTLTGGGATMYVNSNTAMGADLGGSIGFGGLLTTASNASDVNFAIIKGAKATSVSNNENGYLSLAVRSHNAGNVAEVMRITPSEVNIYASGTATELRLFEPTGAGTNWFGLKAAATMAADDSYTWPNAKPVGNSYALTSQTDGTLGWAAPGGAPAGNYGNVAINRNGALATPGTDSLDFDGGLNMKGTLTVSANAYIGAIAGPTAKLHIAAGTTSANTAPLKFTSGSLNTTKVAGQYEYNDNHYLTNNAVRFALGGTLAQVYADVANTATGTLTDLFTYTVPAGTLSTDGDYLEYEFLVSTPDATAIVSGCKVRIGGNDVSVNATATGVASGYVVLKGTIFRVGSGSCRAVGTWFFGASSSTTGTTSQSMDDRSITWSVSNNITVEVWVNASGTGGAGDAVLKAGWVRFYPHANN